MQVPSYTTEYSEGGNSWPRSVPQPQPSTWTLLLRPTTYASSAISQKHVQGVKGLHSRISTTTKEWWFTNPLGRSRYSSAQYMLNSSCSRSKFASKPRLGIIYPKGHRSRRKGSHSRRGLPGLGLTSTKTLRQNFKRQAYSVESRPP